MNSDDFEKRLERQTIRPIPGEWRREILRATEIPVSRRARLLSTLNHQLSTLLWPCPQAWAGLAAVWLVILTVNFLTFESSPVIAQKAFPRSPETLMALRQHGWLFAELNEPREVPVAERPKPLPPRPHSERREEFLAA